jgi:hypothetical protein
VKNANYTYLVVLVASAIHQEFPILHHTSSEENTCSYREIRRRHGGRLVVVVVVYVIVLYGSCNMQGEVTECCGAG